MCSHEMCNPYDKCPLTLQQEKSLGCREQGAQEKHVVNQGQKQLRCDQIGEISITGLEIKRPDELDNSKAKVNS